MTDSIGIRILCVAAAGGCGALARWGLGATVQNYCGDRFPLATLAVNVLGCFAFGLVFAICRQKGESAAFMQLVLLTGFAGAFTTYSTFAFETYDLATTRSLLLACGNIGLQLVLGIAAIAGGVAAAGGLTPQS